MKTIFDPDNWFWRSFGRLADYFILSMIWLACCLPIVTIGTACIALYDTVAHCFRFQEGNMVKRFFGTFKRELLRGILLTVLWAVVGYLLNVGYQIIYQLGAGDATWAVFSLVYLVTLFVPLGAVCWVISLESRFAYSFLQLHSTAFIFTFGHLLQTVAIVALLVAAVIVIFNFPYLLLFLPAALAHLQSFFIEKVFKKYMPDEEQAEIEE